MSEQTDAQKVAIFKCRSVGESFTADDWEARLILVASLQAIHLLARSDGHRTFDDCISDLGRIDDICRGALG